MKSFFAALIGWMVLTGTALAQAPQAKPALAWPTIKQKPAGPQKDKLSDAVIAPLGDLNLNKTPIPQALLDATFAPYTAPTVITCASLAAAIAPLDQALGPDLDTPPDTTNPSLVDRATVLAGDAAISAVRDATTGLVPLRSWVRKFSGAEDHSKKLVAAYAAGAVKRAYLKGIGAAISCSPPAAPLPPQPYNLGKPSTDLAP